MTKVLVINTIGLNYEGITSVIYNYLSSMDRDNLEFNFISFEGMDKELKSKFERFGIVFIVPKRKSNVKSYIKSVNNILKNHYDVVHIHGNSGTMAIETLLSKLHGIKKVIIHCHNITCNHPIFNKLFTPVMKYTADIYIACSNAAGRWLYGKSKYIVLNNAIDLDKFKYNDSNQKSCRMEFGLNNEFVVGHAGHFDKQKNHTFIIDIFAELHKKECDTKLLLISDGPEMEEIKNKVVLLGLEQDVIFAGRRGDMDRLYQAMDLFLLPSLWEGLPVVMLEAQACGLPVLVSDAVTKEAKCTKQTQYLSLDFGAEYWAEKILEIKKTGYIRNSDAANEIRQHGFDIKTEAYKLQEIYLN